VPHIPAAVSRIAAFALLPCLAFVHAGTARAQTPIWMPLDGSPPGTPAELVMDPTASSASRTFLELTLHGFWVTDVTEPDANVYQRISVPGLGVLGVLGAPRLPAARARLAIPSLVPAATLEAVTPLAQPMLFPMNVDPQPIPNSEGADPQPEMFMRDAALYGSAGFYPAAEGVGGPLDVALGSIPAATVELHPMRWDPASHTLEVQLHTRWQFGHEGPLSPQTLITKDREKLGELTFINWGAVDQFYPGNIAHYQGEYLFVYPPEYRAGAKPLLIQKKIRGFTVSEMVTDTIGALSCNAIRSRIQGWYHATPSTKDHYCLLVGDFDVIPMCNRGTDIDPYRTDDLYGSAHGDSLARDIYIGRLPLTGAADLANQIKKIIDYEDHPLAAPLYYHDVLLVAHEEARFVTSHEIVRTAAYATPPAFQPYYGNVPGHSNAGVSNYLNNGYGTVCYRGHGSPAVWGNWDRVGFCSPNAGECFGAANVNALTNGAMTSVVWSVACENGNLYGTGCLGRVWMSKYPGGAVSHYAATRNTSGPANDTLATMLFRAVWDKGITNQAHATTWAEDQAIATNEEYTESNAWSYTLLGDPDMNIRREGPPQWSTAQPAWLALGSSGSGNLPLDFLVHDPLGAPVPGVLVSLWKPGDGAGNAHVGGAIAASADEVADNTYTGPDGTAHFVIHPTTRGMLYFAARDEVGGVVTDSIYIGNPVDVPGLSPAGARVTLRAVPSVARGGTRFEFGGPLVAPATLELVDVRGRVVLRLAAAKGARDVVWDGRDGTGRPAAGGVWFVRARAKDGHALATARFVHLE
jgi:hypothetical protein